VISLTLPLILAHETYKSFLSYYGRNSYSMQKQSLFSPTTDPKQKKLPLAVAGLVLGFLSCKIFGIFSGVPAVICGHISLSKIKSEPENYITAKRLAVSGLFLGYTGIAMTIVLVVGLLMLYFDWGPFEIL